MVYPSILCLGRHGLPVSHSFGPVPSLHVSATFARDTSFMHRPFASPVVCLFSYGSAGEHFRSGGHILCIRGSSFSYQSSPTDPHGFEQYFLGEVALPWCGVWSAGRRPSPGSVEFDVWCAHSGVEGMVFVGRAGVQGGGRGQRCGEGRFHYTAWAFHGFVHLPPLVSLSSLPPLGLPRIRSYAQRSPYGQVDGLLSRFVSAAGLHWLYCALLMISLSLQSVSTPGLPAGTHNYAGSRPSGSSKLCVAVACYKCPRTLLQRVVGKWTMVVVAGEGAVDNLSPTLLRLPLVFSSSSSQTCSSSEEPLATNSGRAWQHEVSWTSCATVSRPKLQNGLRIDTGMSCKLAGEQMTTVLSLSWNPSWATERQVRHPMRSSRLHLYNRR